MDSNSLGRFAVGLSPVHQQENVLAHWGRWEGDHGARSSLSASTGAVSESSLGHRGRELAMRVSFVSPAPGIEHLYRRIVMKHHATGQNHLTEKLTQGR